jgi:four helix bundle suffix protein
MEDKKFQILKRQRPWRDAYYYQKTEVLYQLTFVFCKRFLNAYNDRTVDQMVQAARSGKQNIIEGTEDGVTSTEMHIKLMNVARSSIQELREDYRDFLTSRELTIWDRTHPRYENMIAFCRKHNHTENYQPYFNSWTEEEMANIALTLCYMVDSMMNHYLKNLEDDFVKEGGIKERMHAARTNYRHATQQEVDFLKAKVADLEKEILRLQQIISQSGIKY